MACRLFRHTLDRAFNCVRRFISGGTFYFWRHEFENQKGAYLLAIDQGTTSTRAIVFDAKTPAFVLSTKGASLSISLSLAG